MAACAPHLSEDTSAWVKIYRPFSGERLCVCVCIMAGGERKDVEEKGGREAANERLMW